MIEDIKKNIEVEMSMLKEIAVYSMRLNSAEATERVMLLAAIGALRKSMVIMNDSIPVLLGMTAVDSILPSISKEEKPKLEKVLIPRGKIESTAVIRVKNKAQLLKQLSIREEYVKRLRKRHKGAVEERNEFKATRGYLKIANKLFFNLAYKYIKRGYFKRLSKDLRKANIDMLFEAYVAMALLSSVIAAIIGFFLGVFLLFFNLGIDAPFVTTFKGNILIRLVEVFWIPIIAPIATFILLCFYPVTEKSTLSKKINRELPFAVIHMSAISGSGIPPSEIFRIIGLSKEYPALRKEIRKVLNQINLYGYDLVTALNNASASTPSDNLAELYSGLATTINSGGDFGEFFNKRAETLLMDYRLEREKYAKTAETFMDIYISIVIAAPMILMLLLILLIVGSVSIGFSILQLTILIITATALINVFFLVFIHLKQPVY